MRFRLAFALHNHQPVGNFNAVFEEAHQKCYHPLLKLVAQYPNFRFSLHQSGILWDWQKEHHPEFFELVGRLVDSNQIELLTGAHYEPILPAIPDRDKLGQIALLTTFLKRHFDVLPRGMWLAERVWEPHLPKSLHEAGIQFLPLDDTHFKYSGLAEKQLFGTYITEEAGDTVILLPILQKLRYLIPFGTPEAVMEFLKQAVHDHPGGMAVYADDGEKFGVWPKTYEHCYGDKWLERFFTILEKNADWLEVVPLAEAVESSAPLGRAYLPSASYSEMLHWALPADGFIAYEEFEQKLKHSGLYDTYGQFVRGGHWRGFLAKYPEANLMHKKMLAVSDHLERVAQIQHIDETQLAKAREALYAGQCNCPYWHGVFGGLYLPHLRWAVYRKLIEAEQILRKLAKEVIAVSFEDRDRDGHGEIVLNGQHLAMVIAPAKGGQILELDALDNNMNLADCLTRRREGYHQKLLQINHQGNESSTKSIHDLVLTKEEGLERLLVEDTYLRRPLADHFIDQQSTPVDFLAGRYMELGDFVNGAYDSEFEDADDQYRVTLSRAGSVTVNETRHAVRIEKTVLLPKQERTLTIDYRLSHNSPGPLPVTFAVEFDFNLLAPDAEDRYCLIDGQRPKEAHLSAVAESPTASEITYLDEYLKMAIRITCDRKARLWRLPIYTVSLSEGGFEKVFQGNATLFLFDTALASGEPFTFRLHLYAGALDKLPRGRTMHNMPSARISIE